MHRLGDTFRKTLLTLAAAGGGGGAGAGLGGTVLADVDLVALANGAVADGTASWGGYVDAWTITGADANADSSALDDAGWTVSHNSNATSGVIGVRASIPMATLADGFDPSEPFEISARIVHNADQQFETVGVRLAQSDATTLAAVTFFGVGAGLGYSGSSRVYIERGAVAGDSDRVPSGVTPDTLTIRVANGEISVYVQATGGAATDLHAPGDLSAATLVASYSIDASSNASGGLSAASIFQIFGFAGNANANFDWSVARIRVTQFEAFEDVAE